MRQAVQWIFDNTDTKTIYGKIPKDNKASCHNAVHGGMKFTHEEKGERYFKINEEEFFKLMR